MPARSVGKAIIIASLVAGTLDIADALIFYGVRNHLAPARLLQGIAGHLLGIAAYNGGTPSALLGLAMHYCIAAAWASLFILTATRIAFLKRWAVLSGLLYGVLVFGMMNYVIVPMTLLYKPSPFVLNVAYVNAVAAILVCIGLPIALINKRYA